MREDKEESDLLIRVDLIGSSGVGKSCFVLRFADDTYTSSSIASIGRKSLSRRLVINELRVNFKVFDRYREDYLYNVDRYFKGIHIFMFLVDVTNVESFERVKKEVESVHRGGDYEYPTMCLLRTKCNLSLSDDNIQIPVETLKSYAKKNNMIFAEIDSKDSIGIEEPFINAFKHFKKYNIHKLSLNSKTKAILRAKDIITYLENFIHCTDWKFKKDPLLHYVFLAKSKIKKPRILSTSEFLPYYVGEIYKILYNKDLREKKQFRTILDLVLNYVQMIFKDNKKSKSSTDDFKKLSGRLYVKKKDFVPTRLYTKHHTQTISFLEKLVSYESVLSNFPSTPKNIREALVKETLDSLGKNSSSFFSRLPKNILKKVTDETIKLVKNSP